MTVTLTAGQYKHLQQLSDDNNVISALAIDQRGSLKKMLAAAANKPADETTIVDFKKAVSAESHVILIRIFLRTNGSDLVLAGIVNHR